MAEYGLGPIQRNPKLTVAATPGAIEGLLAPELTHVESSLVTESKAADIFAFAMLALELFTTKPPFGGQLPARTALLISRGNRPEFPQNAEDVGLTPQMQNFLRGCWHHNPIERPTIDEVVRTLELLDSNECVNSPPDGHESRLSALLTRLPSVQGSPNHDSQVPQRSPFDRGCPSVPQKIE